MANINPTIEDSWKRVLWDQFQAPYFASLKDFLTEEKKHYRVFPPGKCIFNAVDDGHYGKAFACDRTGRMRSHLTKQNK